MNRGVTATCVVTALLAQVEAGPKAEAAGAESFFASRVVELSPGPGNDLFPDPALALGGPRGTPGGSLDVVTLGVQGTLVLGFAPGQAITDADGADLIVFENPIAVGENLAFAELVRVGVSTNGVDYAFFPTRCDVPGPVGPYGVIDTSLVSGFAGATPTYANVGDAQDGGNELDPFDPTQAGGDAFDLADLTDDPLVVSGAVDLGRIYYVRLVDVLGDGSESDSLGQPVYDPTGEMDPPWSLPVSADIDAISVIHGLAAPTGGDANRDGEVNVQDLSILASNWQKNPAVWEEGDFNGDAVVNVQDLSLLATTWSAGGTVVPAPPALPLLGLGLAALLVRRTR